MSRVSSLEIQSSILRRRSGQPYWDWSKYADLPTTSNPLYDGSATSLSGNGKYLPNRNGTLQPFPIPDPNPPAIYTAPGTGGGYIFSGPLVDWIQNLVSNYLLHGRRSHCSLTVI